MSDDPLGVSSEPTPVECSGTCGEHDRSRVVAQWLSKGGRSLTSRSTTRANAVRARTMAHSGEYFERRPTVNPRALRLQDGVEGGVALVPDTREEAFSFWTTWPACEVSR